MPSARLKEWPRKYDPKTFSVAERLLKTPHRSGPAKGVTVHLDEMLPVYYQSRGWDAEGVPTKEKLLELGLASV